MIVDLGPHEALKEKRPALNTTKMVKRALENASLIGKEEEPESGRYGGARQGETAHKRPSSSVAAKQHKKSKPDDTLEVVKGEILPYFSCPLCKNVLTNAVVLTSCMHRFCERCIHSWFRTLNSCCCPVCETTCPPNSCLPDIVFEQVLVKVLRTDDTAGAEEAAVGSTVRKNSVGVSGISRGMMNRTLSSVSKPRSTQRVKTLGPPALVYNIAFSLHDKAGSIGPMGKINYVTCPAKKTMHDFKQVLYKYAMDAEQQRQQQADEPVTSATPSIYGFERLKVFLVLGSNRPTKYISLVHSAIAQSEKDGIANSTTFKTIFNAVSAQDQKELRFRIDYTPV